MSSRPGTANPPSIEEGDEDVQQSDTNVDMAETQNLLTVDNLPQETKLSEAETVSDLDPHTEVCSLCDLALQATKVNTICDLNYFFKYMDCVTLTLMLRCIV